MSVSLSQCLCPCQCVAVASVCVCVSHVSLCLMCLMYLVCLVCAVCVRVSVSVSGHGYGRVYVYVCVWWWWWWWWAKSGETPVEASRNTNAKIVRYIFSWERKTNRTISRLVPSNVSLGTTGPEQLHQAQRMMGGIGNMLFSIFSQT